MEGATEEFRCDVLSASQLAELAAAPLPLGIASGAPTRSLHRDLYLDTEDGTLRRRGVACVLRIGADDRHTLSLRIGTPHGHSAIAATPMPAQRVEARVRSTDAREALAENTPVGRRLRAIVDPALLDVRVAIEIERWCRTALHDWLRRPAIELHYDQVTVRRAGASRTFHQLCAHRLRGTGEILPRLAAAFEREHGLRLVAGDRRERAELLLKWMQTESAPDASRTADGLAQPRTGTTGTFRVFDLLDPELSHLAFQERVLTMAEDPATPLRERLRFLSIVSANVDEFFTVRVAGLKAAVRECVDERAEDRRTREEQLEEIAARTASLVERQYRCYRACAAELERHGIRIAAWSDLDPSAKAELRARFKEEMHPSLTPLAMTLSPGHPFPKLPHLALSVAGVLRDREGGPPHFTEVDVPDEVPRFYELGSTAGASAGASANGAAGNGTGIGGGRHVRILVPIEEVVRGNLDVLHPGATVDQAWVFRVTRGGDLALDEDAAADLLEAVDEATTRRTGNAVVRLEVERGMPAVLRDVVLEELRRERGADPSTLGPDDVYEIGGLLDLRALDAIEFGDGADGAAAALEYPPLVPAVPVPTDRPMFDAIRERDVVVHHPFESFDATVVRFLAEAAQDPDVTAIKITLYRTGERSPVADALIEAARQGKSVAAFVELKARFDEARNVKWARKLEKAGGRVVYGLKGLKTHAKVALVVRREGARLRRYVHASTGNYDARAGLRYTDIGLFTCAEPLANDVTDLFNELTGSSAPPNRLEHGALVAPGQMLGALLERIDREAANARAGREAWIRIKANGLSDGDVIRALKRAATDGVRVDLAIRGICTLRPPLDGRLRVLAHVGRFLEHSRIYAFANGGDPLWYIGSADLRPRNLRHRVELLVPVREPHVRARVERIMQAYLDDPSAWELLPTGEYVQRVATGPSAQQQWLVESENPVGWVREPGVTASR